MLLPPELLEDWYARAGDAEAMKELVRGFLTGPVDEAALDRFGREAAHASLPALEGTLRTTLDTDFAGELSSLDIPTLVVAGGRDEFFTVELLRTGAAGAHRLRRLRPDHGRHRPVRWRHGIRGLARHRLAIREALAFDGTSRLPGFVELQA